MTRAEIRTLTLQRLDDTAAVRYPLPLVYQAIDLGATVFATLTLCVEKTGLIAVSDTFTNLLAVFPRLIVPLKLLRGSQRIEAGRIQDWHAEEVDWRMRTGFADTYAVVGANLLAVNRRPISATDHSLTYAATPAPLANDNDSPEIPAEDHPALVDWSVWLLLAFEGGQEFASAADYLKQFLTCASDRAEAVRSRYQQRHYDRLPPVWKAMR